MTRKNTRKTAARARQAQYGGKYLHQQHIALTARTPENEHFEFDYGEGRTGWAMTHGYHLEALRTDVGYRLGCIVGRGNIGVVRDKLTQLRVEGRPEPDLEDAAEQLAVYFHQLPVALGAEGFALAKRQELGGELLFGAEGDALLELERRPVRTTIDKARAKRLVDLIVTRGRLWT